MTGFVAFVDVGLDLDDPAAGCASDQDLVEQLRCDRARVAVEEARVKGAQTVIQCATSTASPKALRTAAGVGKLLAVPSWTET